MKKYNIADLKISMNSRYDRILTQGEKYEVDFSEEPHSEIFLEDKYFDKLKEKYPIINDNNCEYMLGSLKFSKEIIKHNGFVLHASAVSVEDKCYLFSAKSGTGKSTHTSLWLDLFKEKAEIINDDKPAIRYINGEFFVFGTPWSGKSNLNSNKKVKLQCIAFIEQSEKNWIKEINEKEAIPLLLASVYRPRNKEDMCSLLSTLDKLIKSNVKLFKMGCNISLDAAKMSYRKMNGRGQNEN